MEGTWRSETPALSAIEGPVATGGRVVYGDDKRPRAAGARPRYRNMITPRDRQSKPDSLQDGLFHEPVVYGG
ncbi:hypothetical protein J6590_003836 [Homalodisca vitripennis]|nr:hypothetical protein J6590_003836 [Homalodisca vitripennis]